MIAARIALLLAVGGCAVARADAGPYDPLYDFGVHLAHSTIDLDYNGRRVRTAVDRVGLGWREAYGERLRLGLLAGYSYVRQSGHPPTAGRQLDGWHAALTFEVDLWRGRSTRAYVGASFGYERADDTRSGEKVTVSWRIPEGFAGFGWQPGSRLRLDVQATYGALTGEERIENATPSTTRVERGATAGATATLTVLTDPKGEVSLGVRSGVERGARLNFVRRF